MDNDDLVPIGTAARRLGVSVATLRYWDERGIVAPSARRYGQRQYGPDELHRLAVVKMMQNGGAMSLEEIAGLIHGPDSGRDWRQTVRAGRDRVRTQITRLTEAAEYLDHVLSCPNDHPVDNCPVLKAETARHLGRGAAGGGVEDVLLDDLDGGKADGTGPFRATPAGL